MADCFFSLKKKIHRKKKNISFVYKYDAGMPQILGDSLTLYKLIIIKSLESLVHCISAKKRAISEDQHQMLKNGVSD